MSAVHSDDVALDEAFRQAALGMAVFDAYIDNSDRKASNPNCLLEASSVPRLVAIDHDMAFSGLYLHIFGGGGWPMTLLKDHVFTRRFGQKRPDADRIRDKIASLSDAFLDSLADSVPPNWLGSSNEAKLRSVIRKLKERRDTIASWFPDVEAWLEL